MIVATATLVEAVVMTEMFIDHIIERASTYRILLTISRTPMVPLVIWW